MIEKTSRETRNGMINSFFTAVLSCTTWTYHFFIRPPPPYVHGFTWLYIDVGHHKTDHQSGPTCYGYWQFFKQLHKLFGSFVVSGIFLVMLTWLFWLWQHFVHFFLHCHIMWLARRSYRFKECYEEY